MSALSLQCLCEAVSIVEDNREQKYNNNGDSISIRKKGMLILILVLSILFAF
jgi:hypothetical protein